MTEVLTYEALKAERDALERQLSMSEAKCKGYFSEAATALVKCDALAVENAALKLSRETLAKNALETCNDVFSAGFHSPALHRGLMESTGNRNTYPNPISALVNEAVRELDTPATDAELAVIQAQAKAEAIEQLAIQLEQLPDEALEFLSDVAEFETYQEEHHTFVSISNPRAVANAVLSLVKEQSTDPREAK